MFIQRLEVISNVWLRLSTCRKWYVTVTWHRYLDTNDRQELEHDLTTMINMLMVSMSLDIDRTV